MRKTLRNALGSLMVAGALTVASAQQPATPQPDPAQIQQDVDQQDQLPETAGAGALLALIGLGSIGGAAVLRKVRRG